MPLGEKLWEETTRTVGRKVTASREGIHEEVSFVGAITGFGRLVGVEGRIIGTEEHRGKLAEGVMTGEASGVLALGDGFVSFKGDGLARLVRRSPLRAERLVSLLHFIESPPELGWMLGTIVIWEATADPGNGLVTAVAYEWV